MKRSLLFAIFCLLAVGCKTKHDYDGLYIADKQIMGVTRAWIVNGNGLTIHAAGDVKAIRCKQLDGAIELEDERYSFNSEGGIVVPIGKVNVTMRKITKQLEFRPGELEKIIDNATPIGFKR